MSTGSQVNRADHGDTGFEATEISRTLAARLSRTRLAAAEPQGKNRRFYPRIVLKT
jgi:hypothetical protein